VEDGGWRWRFERLHSVVVDKNITIVDMCRLGLGVEGGGRWVEM
jgi:hypothetical protein